MFGDPVYNSQNFPTTEFVNVVTLQRGYDLPVYNRNSGGVIPIYGANGILDYHSEAKSRNGVITGRSGTIGKVYYCEGFFWPLNTTLFSIDNHGNNVIYLAYLLQYFNLKRFYDGTGVPTLNRNIIHKKQIINIPIELQEQFANFVTKVDKQKLTIQQSLDKLEVLKKALMQQYFG
nr:restriction endonuclease subunit S [Clostridium sp. MD294]